jgi:hypothetical protein
VCIVSFHPQADDFSAAVLLMFDPSQPPALIQQAKAYCDQIKASQDGWKLCLQKLHEIGKKQQDSKTNINRYSDHS